MDTKYYVAAGLLASILIVIEHRVSRARGIDAYEFADTINGISHFLGEMVLMVVLYLNVFYGYELLRARAALFDPDPASPWTWGLSFLALDLLYWVGHRACHRVGALWALHAVHHQSKEFNLAVGLRGPWLSALQIAPFMVPLALAGAPASVLFPIYAGHTVWKLLVHTRVVGKLGPLECVLATPSQHRVHHAANAPYIDRNFGGVLSVWDRLFGTFEEETEVPRFERGAPYATQNPIVQNIEPWRELARAARRSGGLGGWIRALALRPAAPLEAPPVAPPATELSRGQQAYVLAQLAVVGAATFAFASFGASLGFAPRLAIGAWLVASLVNLNWMAEGRAGSARVEAARCLLGLVGLVALAGLGVAHAA